MGATHPKVQVVRLLVHWVIALSILINGLFFGCLTTGSLALAQETSRSHATPLIVYRIKASNGYFVEVDGQGKNVSATVEKPRRLVFYKVRGESSAAGIWATFGNLGKVSMRFTPVGVKRFDPPAECQGQQRKIVLGRFVGSFRFKGENGYTRAKASRAQGRVYIWPRWKCKRMLAKARAGGPAIGLEPYVSLDAVARGGDLRFGAMHSPRATHSSAPTTMLTAGLSEQRGRMRVDRLVQVHGQEQSAFTFDPFLNTATVRPPRPFFGAATFVRDVDGLTSWSGPLGVSFPGVSGVRLTGKHFQARLYRH
jgi:hypothetical protein